MFKCTLFALTLLLCAPLRSNAEDFHVEEVVGDSSMVHDALFTPGAILLATSGGVQEFARDSGKLLRTYTTSDGLDSLAVKALTREGEKGALVAETATHRCTLAGERWTCVLQREARKLSEKSAPLSLARYRNRRVTVERHAAGQGLVGTAGSGAFLNGVPLLGGPSLSDAHVTSLALFRGALWVGTFNGGLMARTLSGDFETVATDAPGRMINALITTSSSLFVGASNGLFSSVDGRTFQKIDFVEGAVVGLAYDKKSIWAATTGALYRVQDSGGPPSDVWWMPGGSRSLQKISALPGAVWIATEDRGSVFMPTSPRIVSADRPFSVFDRSRGLASSWSLSAAALDQGGALMTTLREGLIHIKGDGSFEPLPTKVSPWGLATMAEGDKVWFGSQEGAEQISLSTKASSKIWGLPDPRVHVFLRDSRPGKEDSVWIGTEGGLARVKAPLPRTHPRES